MVVKPRYISVPMSEATLQKIRIRQREEAVLAREALSPYRPKGDEVETEEQYAARLWPCVAQMLAPDYDAVAEDGSVRDSGPVEAAWESLLTSASEDGYGPQTYHPKAKISSDAPFWHMAELFAKKWDIADVETLVDILKMPRQVVVSRDVRVASWVKAHKIRPPKMKGQAVVTYTRGKFISGKIYGYSRRTGQYILATNELSRDGVSIRHLLVDYEVTN
jgi:hypothetical protein